MAPQNLKYFLEESWFFLNSLASLRVSFWYWMSLCPLEVLQIDYWVFLIARPRVLWSFQSISSVNFEIWLWEDQIAQDVYTWNRFVLAVGATSSMGWTQTQLKIQQFISPTLTTQSENFPFLLENFSILHAVVTSNPGSMCFWISSKMSNSPGKS